MIFFRDRIHFLKEIQWFVWNGVQLRNLNGIWLWFRGNHRFQLWKERLFYSAFRFLRRLWKRIVLGFYKNICFNRYMGLIPLNNLIFFELFLKLQLLVLIIIRIIRIFPQSNFCSFQKRLFLWHRRTFAISCHPLCVLSLLILNEFL